MIGVPKLGSNCPENLLRYRAVQPDIQAPLDPRHNFSADNRVYNTIWDGHNDTKPFGFPRFRLLRYAYLLKRIWDRPARLVAGTSHFHCATESSINYPNLVPELKCREAFPAVCAGHFFVASSDNPVLKFTQRFFGLHAPNLLGHNRVVALQERLVYQTTTSQKCVSQSKPKSRPEQPCQTAT